MHVLQRTPSLGTIQCAYCDVYLILFRVADVYLILFRVADAYLILFRVADVYLILFRVAIVNAFLGDKNLIIARKMKIVTPFATI